jgi:hypothetical protein
MNDELKEGDEVSFIKQSDKSTSSQKFRIIEVRSMEAPTGVQKQASASGKALYGKEIQEASKPMLSFVIEPLRGGDRLTAKQGEIELAKQQL